MSTVRCIWRLILFRPVLYAVNVVAWTLFHMTPLLTGLVVREYFDALAGRGRTGFGINAIIAASIGFAAGRVLALVWGALLDVRHRFNMKSLLTANVFEQVLERPGAAALDDTVGEAIGRFRDDVMQIEHATSWLLDVVGTVAFAGVSVFVLMRINTKVTLLTFVPMFAVIGLSRAVAQRVEQYRRACRQAASEAVGAMGEAFTAVQGVKLACAEEHVTAHVRRLNERRRFLQLRDRLVTEILDSIYFNTVSIGTGLVLLLAAGGMAEGSFTVGDFSLFAHYIGYISDFTNFFGRMLVFFRQTQVSIQRLVAMFAGAPADRLVRHSPIYLDAPPPETGTPETVPPFEGLEVEGLTCRYPRSQKGIAGASLAVRPGELVVITGRVGSGKTTLVRGLLGAAPRQAGEIRWDGSLVDDPRTFFGPPRTAYVPQVPVLFSDTLRGNVLLGWPDEERLDHALQLSAFEEDLRHMSQGLDTLVGARGLKLSGGQQHRVAAARAFVRAPQLLVIDDLSSAVDVETEAAIWEGLLAEPGLTCLVISHRRTALQRADRIVVLRDGAVEDTGKLDDLLERSAELRAIYFHEQEENAPD